MRHDDPDQAARAGVDTVQAFPTVVLETGELDVDGAFAAARKIVESPRRKAVHSRTRRTTFTSPVCLTRLPCMSPSTKAPEGAGATVAATRRHTL